MTTSAYETVEYADGVAWVTLNRADVLNAFNAAMLREVRDIWRRVRVDDDVRCVVVTGAGDRAFCTGIDRTEVLGDTAERNVGSRSTPLHFDGPGGFLGPKNNDLWKPVIAADNATFFDPHVTYGMAAVFESMHILQKLPLGEVLRMQLLGAHERMSATRADRPARTVQATVRAVSAAQELSRGQALGLGNLLVGLGTDRDSIAEGQRMFASGQRVEWRLR